MTRQLSINLIDNYSFLAGEDVFFSTLDVELAGTGDQLKNSACPQKRAQAIMGYFRKETVTSKKTHPTFLSMEETFGDDEFYVELNKDFAKEICGILPEPFIQLRIHKEDKVKRTEPFSKEELLVVDQTFPLKEILADETWTNVALLGEVAGFRRKTFPYPNDLEGTALHCRVRLGWEEPVTLIKLDTGSFMGKLLEEESTMDLVIVAGNRAEIKCHKLIFAAHTPAFSAMVATRTGMKEARSRRVEMNENSEEGLRQLVRYLYGLGIVVEEMTSDVALELFEMAHKYGLGQLENSLVKMLLGKDVGWFTPDGILELYLYVRNLEVFARLREYSLQLMAWMPSSELRASEEFKKLSKAETVDLSFKLIDFLQKHPVPQEGSKGKGGAGGTKRPRTRSSSSSSTSSSEMTESD